jgi:hypothetical protein
MNLVKTHRRDYCDGCTAADSRHAVNQNIGLPPTLLDKFKSGLKVPTNLKLFAVLHRDVQIVRDILFRMRQKPTAGNRQHGPYVPTSVNQ